MKYLEKSILSFLFLGIGLFLTGCASTDGLKIDKDYDMNKYPGKSIAFGKIDIDIKKEFGIPTLNGFTLQQSTGNPSGFPRFSRDEYFFIALEPGEYIIKDIFLGHGLSGAAGMNTCVAPVYKRFTVGQNEIVYIGKLLLEGRFDSYSNVIDKQIKIFDEYDQAVNEFHKQYPNIKKDINKNLLQ